MMKKLLALSLLMSFLALTTHAYAEAVYATKNGAKYHKENCPLIKSKGAEKIDMEEATQRGLEPCKRCFKAKTDQDASLKQEQKAKSKEKKS